MSTSHPSGDSGFGAPWASEAVMEVGLALAALGFTAAIWFSSDDGTGAQRDALRQAAASQSPVTHITLATVLVQATGR